jgi:hypothetical protein
VNAGPVNAGPVNAGPVNAGPVNVAPANSGPAVSRARARFDFGLESLLDGISSQLSLPN